MIRGMYTAASGMVSTLLANDTVADNLANLSTSGFKTSNVNFQSFYDMVMHRVTKDGTQEIGSINNGASVRGTVVDFKQGALVKTGNPFDFAIDGDGFFSLQAENGQNYYSRSGNFVVNQDGYLTDVQGNQVLGDNDAPIQINLNAGPVRVLQSGSIQQAGAEVGRLKITRFENNHTLQKAGNSLFTQSDPSQIIDAQLTEDGKLPCKIEQGTIELSNSNSVAEMIRSINGLRLYETLQKNIRMHNDMLGKAVNEVGRFR